MNPHKWLFVPVDCSVLYLRQPETTREAFSVVPDYLRSPEDAPNLMDYGIALGRRFRALKLWMVLRSMGTEGVVGAIREHIRLARLLASWVEEDPDFELAAPVPLSVVNFRYAPPGVGAEQLDALNEALVEAVDRGGRGGPLGAGQAPGGPGGRLSGANSVPLPRAFPEVAKLLRPGDGLVSQGRLRTPQVRTPSSHPGPDSRAAGPGTRSGR